MKLFILVSRGNREKQRAKQRYYAPKNDKAFHSICISKKTKRITLNKYAVTFDNAWR
jgi:hypothetical protein